MVTYSIASSFDGASFIQPVSAYRGVRSGHIHIPPQIFVTKFFCSFSNLKNRCLKMKPNDRLKGYPSIFHVSVVPPKATRSSNCQLSQYEWLAFFCLKSPKVEPPSYSEMAHSYFLLRGRLAFVWRETHIVGWLSTVGERSVLVIRPYLYRLNSQSNNSSTMAWCCRCHNFIPKITDNSMVNL